MFRRVVLCAFAALLAVSATVSLAIAPSDGWPSGIPGAAAQAHATGGACGGTTWTDNPGTVYDNGDYRAASGNNFWDSYQGKYTHINVDIQSWRYTTTGSDGWPAGRCLRNVRYSGWVDDGDYGSMNLQARAWVCGSLVYQTGQGYLWEGGHSIYLGWIDYSGCGGPSADTWYTGHNADWTGYYPNDVPSAYINL